MTTRAEREAKARIEDKEEIGGYITIPCAAGRYGIDRLELHNYIKRGHVPAIRLGDRCLMIKPEDLDSYLAAKKMGRPKKNKDISL